MDSTTSITEIIVTQITLQNLTYSLVPLYSGMQTVQLHKTSSTLEHTSIMEGIARLYVMME